MTDTTTDPARGRPHSVEADRAIIGATLALLEEQGYAGLTMAGISERASVSTATIYRRCASKEDLVVWALRSVVEERPPADTGSLEGDLQEMLRRIAEHLTGERGRMFLGLAGEITRHPGLKEAVRLRFQEPLNQNVADMLARATERGEIPAPVDTQAAVAIILGPLHYWLLQGDTVGPSALEALVPMARRALGA